MYDTPRTREQILTMLAEAPARIVALTQGMTVAQLLAHLRACADMWGKYIVLILSQDRPTFKAVNPTTWIKSTDYLQQEFRPMLQAYAAQRLELLAVLKPLRP